MREIGAVQQIVQQALANGAVDYSASERSCHKAMRSPQSSETDLRAQDCSLNSGASLRSTRELLRLSLHLSLGSLALLGCARQAVDRTRETYQRPAIKNQVDTDEQTEENTTRCPPNDHEVDTESD